MFFEQWHKKNIESFEGMNEKEKMLMAYNYGFEEGIKMGRESVPAETLVRQGDSQPVQTAGQLPEQTLDDKTKILMAAKIIMEEMPLTCNYQEDGRYVYPARWNALMKILIKE